MCYAEKSHFLCSAATGHVNRNRCGSTGGSVFRRGTCCACGNGGNPDSAANQDANTYSYSGFDGRANSNRCSANAASDQDTNAGTNGNKYANTNAGANSNKYANTESGTNSHSYATANQHPKTYGHSYAAANQHPKPDSHSYAAANQYPNTKANQETYSYAKTYSHKHPNLNPGGQ